MDNPLIPPPNDVTLRVCANARCDRQMPAAELAGGHGAPSGENLPTMGIADGWIEEPADGHGRLLCGDCASDEEVVEYMADLDDADEIVARLVQREDRRLEPTADEATADEQARLIFGVEPVDPDDYGSLA